VLGGGYVIDVEARGGDAVRNQLAAVPCGPGAGAGPGLYGSIARRSARRDRPAARPLFDLLGIRFAEPSLNEVYTRYFDEVRDAA